MYQWRWTRRVCTTTKKGEKTVSIVMERNVKEYVHPMCCVSLTVEPNKENEWWRLSLQKVACPRRSASIHWTLSPFPASHSIQQRFSTICPSPPRSTRTHHSHTFQHNTRFLSKSSLEFLQFLSVHGNVCTQKEVFQSRVVQYNWSQRFHCDFLW